MELKFSYGGLCANSSTSKLYIFLVHKAFGEIFLHKEGIENKCTALQNAVTVRYRRFPYSCSIVCCISTGVQLSFQFTPPSPCQEWLQKWCPICAFLRTPYSARLGRPETAA
jgi:hypothetical protein